MQDQLTGGQSSLQQPRSDLQQNTTNLQQSGSPTSAGNTSSVLSEAPPSSQLRVSTAASPTPSTVAPSTVHPGSNVVWLWLLIIPLAVLALLLIPQKPAAEILPPIVDEPEPLPVSTPPTQATKKTKKKSTKRKKSSKR